MQSLYELLKASKGLPVSDSYAALWAKKAESGIKTLTGKLPLFFSTSENKLRDWVIYGNNEVGKNLVRVTNGSTIAGITFTVDPDAGTVTANGTASKEIVFSVFINSPDEQNNSTVPLGNYYFSACPSGGGYDSYNCYSWDVDTHARSKQWDGTTPSVTDSGQGNCQVQINGHKQAINMRIYNGYTASNVVFKPMLRKAGTSEAFEPYQIGVGKKTENGYVLNIGVGFAPIPAQQPVALLDTKKTIYIGESPLTEGQTLSMSEFGDIETQPYTDMFIAAFEGFNYDDQLSYNQPEMRLKYKE